MSRLVSFSSLFQLAQPIATLSSKLAPPTNLEPYTMAVITEHGGTTSPPENNNSIVANGKPRNTRQQLSTALTIPEFFAHKNIFVTGGTGFLGTVLIEALLDTHPNIGTIYVLVRGKRKFDASERIRRLLQKPVRFVALYYSFFFFGLFVSSPS